MMNKVIEERLLSDGLFFPHEVVAMYEVGYSLDTIINFAYDAGKEKNPTLKNT